MDVAAVLPSLDLANDTAAVVDWAQAAEEIGCDRIIVYDHVLGVEHEGRAVPLTGPYTEDDPFREPLTLFAHLAGVTRRIELMSGVMVLPQRQTVLVAKQAAEVDLFSAGRLVLGVGIGWNDVEYESMGVKFAERGARLEEQVEVLRLLWAEPIVDYRGRFHRIDRAALLPRPAQSIPIWFGGRSPNAIERAARLGDGFFFTAVNDESCSAAARLLEIADRERISPRRESHPFGLAAQINPAAGIGACEDEVRRWAALAGSHIAVDTMQPRQSRMADPSAVGERLRRHLAALVDSVNLVRSA
jgi:probable F420-dependent oxidoreductase